MSGQDLLLEIGTEELPPRALLDLSVALALNLQKGVDEAGIAHGKLRRFATPRRLAVWIEDLAPRQPDREIEKRGPPMTHAFQADGAPTQAALAFAKGCGVAVTALETQSTEKGSWLLFRGREAGAATVDLLGGIVNQAIAALPIAKRMRWGAGAVEFVRPVHSLVLLLGDEVVACEALGLVAGRTTFGHRFHAPRPIALKHAKSYEGALRRAKVIADFDKRRELIRDGVQVAAAGSADGDLLRGAADAAAHALIDPALLDEVTALVEWPVPIAGRFDQRFLSLPREVVIATIQDHQRYFPIEGAGGRLTGGFVTVANIASREPAKVREGNERVVRPRLSDAAFFWEQDCKLTLQQHAAKLSGVTFQAKLGTYADKTLRVTRLAEQIGGMIGAGPEVGRAASLAKADLMTAMVGEFPELQGTMGRYYAAAQGEPPEFALALEEHYRPRFAGDSLPAGPLGQALALADKLDTLAGIFCIDQKPTGTKDPFGLRRAALGVLRILLEKNLDLDLPELVRIAAAAQPVQRPAAAAEIEAFITERLRGLLLEQSGVTAEMVEAVLASGPRSPPDAAARLQALKEFLLVPGAGVFAAINKRIANILKKARLEPGAAVDARHFSEDAERHLHEAYGRVQPAVSAQLSAGRYAESLRLLAGLGAAVDGFFAAVMVMDENLERRNNRLALLRDVGGLFGGVADFSRLPG
jgi:glycyl-tRNA synthetase beta chain